jgi:ATP-dependent Zn protease
MSRVKMMSLTVKLLVILACVASVAGALAGATVAATTAPSVNVETLTVFERQLDAGEIKSATFRRKAHSLHLTLSDGHHAELHYGHGEAAKLGEELKAHNVSVVSRSPGHKLRYIVGGIVIVVVILVLLAGFILVRRRRAAADTY